MKRLVLCLFLVTVLMVSFQIGNGYAKTFKWRIQSAFSRGDFSADLLPSFAEEVKKKSDGRLVLQRQFLIDNIEHLQKAHIR